MYSFRVSFRAALQSGAACALGEGLFRCEVLNCIVSGEPVSAGFFVFRASNFEANKFFIEIDFDLADGVFLFSSHFVSPCLL